MTDREKVIKGLECCAKGNVCFSECPYFKEVPMTNGKCITALQVDAFSLLKEQDASGWISVNDRLPNDGQDVLAYLYNGEETRIVPFNYDKGTWYDCVMNCTVAINSITHWMPLPEPPKEVSE